jgi:membrane-associated phospholipid phosphatase
MPPAHSPQSDESSSRSGAQVAAQGKKREQAKNAQAKDEALQMTSSSTSPNPAKLAKDFFDDQKHIWSGPARIRFSDATWLVPVGGLTAGLFVTDRQFSAHLSKNSQTLNHYGTLSNAGVGALIGAAGGLYFWGQIKHDDRRIETGLLAGEAVLNSLVVVQTLKYMAERPRPFEDNGSGRLFHGGTSFPSEHTVAAFAIAGIISHEYPGPLTKLISYGLASAVSFSRVRARDHFPSDAAIGGIIGELIAQQVYSRHHNPEVGGTPWEYFGEQFRHVETGKYAGSPYVPLDSWIYPALERLAALGYIHSEILGLRPWTRSECARLLDEAGDRISDEGTAPSEVQGLYRELESGFSAELESSAGDSNRHVKLESVYTRFTQVTGGPLTDNYHFGQTVINDFGRPYERGFNNVTGLSAWATDGPFTLYIRGEYQHAPSAPAPSQAVLSFISGADGLPSGAPATPIATTNRFRLLDCYVGMNVANWQVSFGKQSLWWGPNEGGPFLFSDNAEPITMFRVSRNSPFRLPGILGLLGDIRMEAFTGQLSGHQFVTVDTSVGPTTLGQFGQTLNPQPFLDGQKVSFRFTRNFEFGVSKTDVFSGKGTPFTLHKFLQSVFLFRSASRGFDDFGDPRIAVDFSYRIPKLRDWLTFYGDAFTKDEISPLGYPRKSVFQAGLYLPKLPRLPKLDLRLEGGSTVPPDFPDCHVGCFYQDHNYLNSYTSNDKLMGAGIGRAAQSEEIRSNYWLSPKNKIAIQLRHRKVDSGFLTGGGTQNDGSVSADFFLRPAVSVAVAVQYERWQIPLLARGPQSNVSASVQTTFLPGHWSLGKKQ